uniref:Uncharacterized protein n=1 Tax=Rhizophora mucronata TaxID=61149 RepID=A0A2P2K7J2_RHIMU
MGKTSIKRNFKEQKKKGGKEDKP